MDTNATCRIWMADQLLQGSAAGDVCRVADESGVPYRMVPLAERHRGSPSPPRDAGGHWHLLIIPEQLHGANHERLTDFDDVVSLSSPSWQDELRAGLRWLQRVDELTRRLERDVGIVGRSDSIVELRKQMAHALLDSDANVLILGETGTGKRVIAEALHRGDDRRRSHPFHCIDAGATVPGLFGSELFGHMRGAFTGASESRPGAIRTAGEGTLLLDEVGELPMSLQSSLLSVLQERVYRAVGSDRDQPLKCRVVSATNRDLDARVRDNEFREDLKYRLAQVTLRVPSLRERREDLPALAGALVRRYRAEDPPACAADLLEYLQGLNFPGNVRELEALLRQAVVRANGSPTLRLTHLPRASLTAAQAAPGDSRDAVEPLERSLAALRKALVCRALQCAGRALPGSDRTAHVAWAAERLEISARSVYNYLNGDSPAS